MKKIRVFCRFFEYFPKFSEFVNSGDCIGKISSKSIGLYHVFFSNEKIRNSGNFIYDCAHSSFGEDF